MDESEELNKIALLEARLEELTQALALTNEKMTKFIANFSTMEFDDGRLWLKLGIKPIGEMTKEELLALNDSVSIRQLNKHAFSTDAKVPNQTEVNKLYEHRTGGYEEAIASLLKNVIFSSIHGGNRNQDEEVTEKDLEDFLALGKVDATPVPTT